MTIKELIQQLETFDGDLVVSFQVNKEIVECAAIDITSLKIGYVVLDEEDGEFYLENEEGDDYLEGDEGVEKRLIFSQSLP